MKYGNIIIEKREYELLKSILSTSQFYREETYKQSLEKLKGELVKAKIVDAKKLPDDVIRFNSVVTIETPWNVQRSYQVVVPEQSDIKQDKISILAPMGLALFGYAKGDEFTWQFPIGANTIKILEVVQPTATVKIEDYERKV